MSLKAKIIAQFKTKYPTVALSNERLDAIADRLDSKITEETEIDAKLDELNEIFPFADIAKDDDRLRNAEAKAKKKPETPKQKAPAKKDADADEPEPEPKDNDPILQMLKEMREELSGLKADKIVKSRIETAKERFKNVPKELQDDLLTDIQERNFQSDEEYEGFLTRKEKAISFAVKVEQDGKFGKDKPFGGVGGSNGKPKPASDAEVDEVFNQIKR